jgi:hypothetical protein
MGYKNYIDCVHKVFPLLWANRLQVARTLDVALRTGTRMRSYVPIITISNVTIQIIINPDKYAQWLAF